MKHLYVLAAAVSIAVTSAMLAILVNLVVGSIVSTFTRMA